MAWLTAGTHSMALIALWAVFAAVATGCVPPDSEQFSKPVTSSPAGSEPVVLNGAGGKISASAAKTEAKSGPPVAAAAGAPASPVIGPVFAAKPLPPKPAIPEIAAAPPDPAATPEAEAMRKNADGYPNINAPAKEPAGSLLPADERARVISELEALRNKGGAPAKAAAATQVAKKTGATKADGKCPDGATAAADPDCKSSDQ